MLRHLFAAAIALCAVAAPVSAQTLYYNIAHAINNTRYVSWAVLEGANAIEADLNFNDDGTLLDFQHRPTCECQLFWDSGDNCAEFRRDNVYQYDAADSRLTYIRSGKDACLLAETAKSYLNHLAQHTSIALFIVDSKVARSAKRNEALAGANVIRALDDELFGHGYRGKVIVGVASSDEQAYLRAAVDAARVSPNAGRIYFSFDEDGSGNVMGSGGAPSALAPSTSASRTIDRITAFTDRGVYGNGVSAALPGDYGNEMLTGVAAERSGRTRLTYIWTLESADPMTRYLDIGVRGLMTNNPATLNRVLQPYLQRGGRLARPDDPEL